MQRTGETYTEYQKRVLCANASTLANNIVNPSCVDGEKEYRVTVIYHELERDTHELCGECKDTLKKDAEKHGYKVEVEELEG